MRREALLVRQWPDGSSPVTCSLPRVQRWRASLRRSKTLVRIQSRVRTVKLTQFIAIMLYAAVAGVMWGTWLSLGRTMSRYDVATFLADGQHMIANLGTVMAVLMIAALVVSLFAFVLLLRRGSMAAAWLMLASVLLLGAVIAVTLSVNVPLDNKIKTWTVETLPADWQELRTRSANFHTLLTFLSVAGLAAAVGAALTVRSGADRRDDRTAGASQPVAPARVG